eukprot:3647982-Ditylum_brightwellii.AAC.1
MDESGAPDHQQRSKEPAVMVRGGGMQEKSARGKKEKETSTRITAAISSPPLGHNTVTSRRKGFPLEGSVAEGGERGEE